jgi:hypothetical protein
MIINIPGTPANIVAFKAIGEITRRDFDLEVFPQVQKLVKQTGKLNYLMWIDTGLENFTAGAWWKDALLGITNFTKWHRAAIVSDSRAIQLFTDIFSVAVPGEFKGFEPGELEQAIQWVAGDSL